MTLGPVIISQELTRREVRSAGPDAPVVTEAHAAPARPRLRRTRATTATVLHRAAARIAPAC